MKHSRHALRYVDLHPEPVDTREPSTLAIWAGAAFAMLTLWVACAFVFSF